MFFMHDLSGDNHGGSRNAAVIAVGVVVSIIALLLLGTGIIVIIVIISLRVKNKSSQQSRHEGKEAPFLILK